MVNNITKPNFGILSNNTADQPQGIVQPWTPKPTLKDVKPYEPSGGALVEDRMTGLLEKGSPYLQAAEQRALQTAGKRGLLNTTMAAGAGTAAAIEAALPIASQDAAAFQQAKMAGYQGDINNWLADQKYLRDVDLANQGYASDVGLIGVQESASSRLSRQTAEQTAALSTQEAGQVLDLSTQAARQVAALSSQEAGQTSRLSTQTARQTTALSAQEAAQSAVLQQQIDQAATSRTQINVDAQKMIAGANLSSGERTNFGNQLIQLSGNASTQIAAIQADPNMTAEAKTAAIKSVNDAYQSYVDSLVSIYGGTVEWVGLGETPTDTTTDTLPSPSPTPSPTPSPAPSPAPDNTMGQLTGNYQGTPITADVAEDGGLYMNGQPVGTWSYSGQGNFYNVTFTDGSTATYDYDSGMMYGQGWSLQLGYSPSS